MVLWVQPALWNSGWDGPRRRSCHLKLLFLLLLRWTEKMVTSTKIRYFTHCKKRVDKKFHTWVPNFCTQVADFIPLYQVSYPCIKFHTLLQNFVHMYQTSYPCTTFHNYVPNFIPFYKILYPGSKISYLCNCFCENNQVLVPPAESILWHFV
jgi:hypothetical protein